MVNDLLERTPVKYDNFGEPTIPWGSSLDTPSGPLLVSDREIDTTDFNPDSLLDF